MTWTDYGAAVRVHHLDSGEHVLAVDGMWWPGVYASPDAARLAAGISYERVAEIWAAILTKCGPEHAVIREDDLGQLKAAPGALQGALEIKCRRCGGINLLRPREPTPERQERPDKSG